MKMLVASMLLELDGHILLLNRRDGFLWCPPGGHVEEGETILDAGIRELAEEVGVWTNTCSCIPCGYYERVDLIAFFFFVPIWNGVPTNLEPEKHVGIAWYKQWPKYLVPALDAYKKELDKRIAALRVEYDFAIRKVHYA